MRQKIENNLHIEVAGADLTGATKPELYPRNHTGRKAVPSADSSAWLSGRTGLPNRISCESDTGVSKRHCIKADSHANDAGVTKDFAKVLRR